MKKSVQENQWNMELNSQECVQTTVCKELDAVPARRALPVWHKTHDQVLVPSLKSVIRERQAITKCKHSKCTNTESSQKDPPDFSTPSTLKNYWDIQFVPIEGQYLGLCDCKALERRVEAFLGSNVLLHLFVELDLFENPSFL